MILFVCDGGSTRDDSPVPRPGKMLRTIDFFNLLSKLFRHLSHGSSQVREVLWAFAMTQILNGETPKFRRKVKMRRHRGA